MLAPSESGSDSQLLPSSSIRSLFSSAASQINKETVIEKISEALEYWSSGLLAHEHPAEPHLVRRAFVDLLNSETDVSWGGVEERYTEFLIEQTLNYAADALTDLSESPEESVLQVCETCLKAGVKLITCRGYVPVASIADAIFVILRIDASQNLDRSIQQTTKTFSEALSEHRGDVTHLTNTNFTKLVERLSKALSTESDTPSPEPLLQVNNLAPCATVLNNVITVLDERRLVRHNKTLYALLHPLIEHVHPPTRCAGLEGLTYMHEKQGAKRESLPFLRGSLLWADSATAMLAIPLLCAHLESLRKEDEEILKCRKRVLGTMISLMTARDGRNACVRSTKAAVLLSSQLLSFQSRLLQYSDKWLCALGTFLGRVSGLSQRGEIEKESVVTVCETIKESICWCWLRADGFRGKVMEGCLIAVKEVPSEEVFIAVRGVIHILACCNPGRMKRLLSDLRETCLPYPSLKEFVQFLDSVQPLVEVECKKVEMGDLLNRFFPELNQFNT